MPFHLVLGNPQFGFFYWFITFCFAIDIVVNFFTAYKQNHAIITDFKQIAKRYFKTWFWIDLLAAIPFSPIASLFVQSESSLSFIFKLILLLRLIRLVKLLKIKSEIHLYESKIVINPSLLRLLVFVFWLSLSLHFISLGWILIRNVNSAFAPLHQYLDAFYWCITTISTIGYGDITPDRSNPLQVLYTIAVQLFGVGMFGYVIGNVASLLANLDIAKANYQKKMEEINLFLANRKIPRLLQERVIDYYKYLWDTRRSTETSSVLTQFPQTIQTDISLFLNRDIVEKVPFFKDAKEIFIREIIQCLELIIYLPNDYIIRQGEYGDCMYFLCKGDVKVVVNEATVAQLATGAFFGEMSLVKGEKRNASIQTTSYCDVYRLSKKSFDTLRSKYQEFDQHVQELYLERISKNKKKA